MNRLCVEFRLRGISYNRTGTISGVV